MREKRTRKTRILALCAMLSALGVVLIWCSVLLEVLDLSVAALASILTVFAVIELGGGYPWMIYGVTALLSVILMPQNSGAYCYLLFFGYYPMLKSVFERRLPKVFGWLAKFAVFNAAFSVFVFLLPLLLTSEPYQGGWYLVLMYAGGNALLFLFDFTLTKLVTLYLYKLRGKLHVSKWLK